MDLSIFTNLVLIAYAVCSAVNCAAHAASNHRLAAVTKPMLMPVLIFFYLLASESPDPLVIAALGAGFLGDVFLMYDGVLFTAGILSFFSGHLFYIIKLVGSIGPSTHQSNSTAPYPFAIWMKWLLPVLIFAAYGIFIAKRLKPHTGRWFLPLIPYIAALLTTGYFACMYFITSLNREGAMVLTGALFFIASDSMLSYDLFICKRKWRTTAVMVTYTLAQGLLVGGLL